MPFRPALAAALLVLFAASVAHAAGEGEARIVGEKAGPESALPRRCAVCHLDKAPAASRGVIAFAPPAGSAEAGERGMCYSCHNGLVLDSRRSQWTGRHHPASGRVQCGSCHSPHVQAPNTGMFMKFERGSFRYCATCHAGRRTGEPGEHPAIAAERGRPRDCGACHEVHRAAGPGLIREPTAERLCRPCHGDNPSREGRGPGTVSHVIAGKGPACLGCHQVHGTVGGRALLEKTALDGRLCRQCHEREFSASRGAGNHPIAPDRASCLSCHRMHNAAKPGGGRSGLLTKGWMEVDAICGVCHAKLGTSEGTWNHPLGGSAAEDARSQGELLAKLGAFFLPGAKTTCLSCHKAHGAVQGTPQLVVHKEALCLYCHPAQNALDPEQAALGAHPVSVRPRRARIDEAFLRAGGEVGSGGEILCMTCHRAHGAAPGTPGLVLARDSYSCLLCHKEEVSIASTPHSAARAPGGIGAGLCGGCHGEHGWRLPVGTADEAGPTVIERVCAACHQSGDAASFGGVTNHALGLSPEEAGGTAGLPFFGRDGRRLRRGALSCATCHDVHREGTSGYFLRQSLGAGREDFCLGCHRQQEVVIGTKHDLSAGTGPVCSPCHPMHALMAPASWRVGRGGEDGATADLSAFCGGCHREGGAASAAIVGELGHPAVPSEAPGDGAAKSVGCGGCHNPHRWNPRDPADRGAAVAGDGTTDFLVRPATGSAELCIGCHADQAAVTGTAHDFAARAPAGGRPAGPADPRREGVCGGCHRVHGGDPVFLLALPPAGDKADSRVDPCERCHAAGKLAPPAPAATASHPVGAAAGQDFGPDLPLYDPTGRRRPGGKLACSTCHDAHRWAPLGGSGGSSRAATSFLRMGADGYAPLCFPCHADKSQVAGTDHDLRVTAPKAVNRSGDTAEASGVCGVCHAVHGASGSFALWNRDLGDGADVLSRSCRGCHRPGNDVGARVPPRPEAHLVNYPGRGLVGRLMAITRGAAGREASEFTLYTEEGARADQGFLSCASCHDAHRWEPGGTRAGAGVPAEGDITSSFLRLPGGASADLTFCTECHAQTWLQYNYRDYHFPAGR